MDLEFWLLIFFADIFIMLVDGQESFLCKYLNVKSNISVSVSESIQLLTMPEHLQTLEVYLFEMQLGSWWEVSLSFN